MQAWRAHGGTMGVSMRGSVRRRLTNSPECMGLPIACWYIGLMMLFIPFPFSHIFHANSSSDVGRDPFPQGEVSCCKRTRVTKTDSSSLCTFRPSCHCSRLPSWASSTTCLTSAGGTNCQSRSSRRYRRYWSTIPKGASLRSSSLEWLEDG